MSTIQTRSQPDVSKSDRERIPEINSAIEEYACKSVKFAFPGCLDQHGTLFQGYGWGEGVRIMLEEP